MVETECGETKAVERECRVMNAECRISSEHFQSEDTVATARFLLGKQITTHVDGLAAGGLIIETEAYLGTTDRASHAFGGRRTPRTEIMYRKGGIAYIYFCYGMHHLLNIVTGPEGVPHAVLIRALQPTIGLETMHQRRKGRKSLASGPGMVCQALGLSLKQNGNPLQIEDVGVIPADIAVGPRIGVDYAGPDALLPLRFCAIL